MTEISTTTPEATLPEAVEVKTVASETPQAEAPVANNATTESIQIPDLYGQLGDDLKDNKSLEKFKNVDELAKSYLHLNGHLGKKFNELPAEELSEVYMKLGRPEEKTGYELNLDTAVNEEFVDWYKDKAFDLGLTQKQASKFANSYMELEKEQMEVRTNQQKSMQQDWVASIKAEYGDNFDSKLGSAKRALTQFGGDDLTNYLNETGLGDHPAMVKAFANIGEQMGEGKYVDANSSASFGSSPEDAQNEIALLKADPKFQEAYTGRNDAARKAATAKLAKLYAVAFPG